MKDEVGESISSFSNSKGGIILIGISDKREIKGVQIGRKTVRDLAGYIKRNTDPQIFPEIKICKIDNKKIVSIKVKESNEKPVFSKSYAYKRVGDTNQRISSSEIRALAKEFGGKTYWDEQICEGASLKDIDEEKIKRFLKKGRFERRLDIIPTISVREALKRLNLIKK
ncbi:MAG: putative DNA binding domain-containing protein [Candidatus Aerophobetes bacterium]|nr:putative DNA binding domain-containing protein [Candidatus Aerophobetes bacterium]